MLQNTPPRTCACRNGHICDDSKCNNLRGCITHECKKEGCTNRTHSIDYPYCSDCTCAQGTPACSNQKGECRVHYCNHPTCNNLKNIEHNFCIEHGCPECNYTRGMPCGKLKCVNYFMVWCDGRKSHNSKYCTSCVHRESKCTRCDDEHKTRECPNNCSIGGCCETKLESGICAQHTCNGCAGRTLIKNQYCSSCKCSNRKCNEMVLSGPKGQSNLCMSCAELCKECKIPADICVHCCSFGKCTERKSDGKVYCSGHLCSGCGSPHEPKPELFSEHKYVNHIIGTERSPYWRNIDRNQQGTLNVLCVKCMFTCKPVTSSNNDDDGFLGGMF